MINTVSPICTHHPMLIFDKDGLEIYAGGIASFNTPRDYNLVINLTGFHSTVHSIECYGAAAILFARLRKPAHEIPAEVVIDWPDFGIPTVTKSDWKFIFRAIRKVKGKILVYCQGGHGRTGTFLALLAHYTQHRPALKMGCVQWVRKVYCKQAVESLEQHEYLTALGVAKVPKMPLPAYSLKNWEQMGYYCYSCRKTFVSSVPMKYFDQSLSGVCLECSELTTTQGGIYDSP